ncbi:hypothetical protein PMKS-003668 [Pichia membranifaciens]|uniref:Uncharacterized protein n=1 Tax=Pichia membranifaciens TaxID=4926 RepID=A0A1Q2YKU3_9ASCO|nr:hypothetical protein PMKS-003668 [Pichia membranifaciens]
MYDLRGSSAGVDGLLNTEENKKDNERNKLQYSAAGAQCCIVAAERARAAKRRVATQGLGSRERVPLPAPKYLHQHTAQLAGSMVGGDLLEERCRAVLASDEDQRDNEGGEAGNPEETF